MTSVYNLLREACGISQAEAAELVHDARLDSVRSWCADRRSAPAGVLEELRELAHDVDAAAADLLEQLKPGADGSYAIGTFEDDVSVEKTGFPPGAAHRAIALAIARLPRGAEVRLVAPGRGIPTVRRQPSKKPGRAGPGRAS
jgi:hypothetical protein